MAKTKGKAIQQNSDANTADKSAKKAKRSKSLQLNLSNEVITKSPIFAGHSIPLEIKKKVVAEREKGLSSRQVAKLFGLNKSSVSKICTKYKYDGSFVDLERAGATKGTCLEDDILIYNEIKKNPNVTADEIEKLGVGMIRNTVRRRIKEFKLKIQKEDEKAEQMANAVQTANESSA